MSKAAKNGGHAVRSRHVEAFGATLCRLRRGRYTQAELAERMNVHVHTVQRWEAGKGEATVTLDDVAAAAAVFGGDASPFLASLFPSGIDAAEARRRIAETYLDAGLENVALSDEARRTLRLLADRVVFTMRPGPSPPSRPVSEAEAQRIEAELNG